ADITDLEAFRKSRDGRGPKLTVTAFALKAAAIALKQFPNFNASLDLANNQLVLKRYYHIGVAVDTERGLVVPVIRGVEKKSIEALAAELTETADQARKGKFEMTAGGLTIRNRDATSRVRGAPPAPAPPPGPGCRSSACRGAAATRRCAMAKQCHG